MHLLARQQQVVPVFGETYGGKSSSPHNESFSADALYLFQRFLIIFIDCTFYFHTQFRWYDLPRWSLGTGVQMLHFLFLNPQFFIYISLIHCIQKYLRNLMNTLYSSLAVIFLFGSFLEWAIQFLNSFFSNHGFHISDYSHCFLLPLCSFSLPLTLFLRYKQNSQFHSMTELLLGLCLKTWTEQHCINKWMSCCQCTMRAEGSLWRKIKQ